MKSIIITLALVAGFAANAGSLKSFTGKYELGECNYFSGSRAYIALEKNKEGKVTGLSCSIYGDDATGFGMFLGRELEDNPNFKFGNPIKQTLRLGFWRGNTLVNTMTNIYGDGRKELANVETLAKTKTGVRWTQSHPARDDSDYCELKKIK